MITRNGKIAHLPHSIRTQINQRLHDGETGVSLVEWLNSLPEVRAVLAANFHGRPISEQNISEWKAGGYEDWLEQQEVLASVQHTLDDAAQLKATVPGSLAEPMAQLLVARLSLALRQLRPNPENGEVNCAALHALCADLVELRRGDQNAERMRIERERLQIERERLEMDRQQMQLRTVEQFWAWAQQDEIKEKICGCHDNTAALEMIGRALFGEDWKGIEPEHKDCPPAPPPAKAPDQPESDQIKPDQTTPPAETSPPARA